MKAAGESSPSRTDQPSASGLRHNRNYWWLWFGQAISVVGDEIFTITLTLWIATVVVRGESWAPLAVTAVLVAETVPAIFLSPIAGVYCDRWDRRRIMLIADAVRCVLIAAMAGIVFAAPSLPQDVLLAITYTVTALASTASVFFNPAKFGMLAVIVDDTDRERASSITMGTYAIAGIVGPALGAVLLVAAGAGWAMLLNAGSFAVSFLALARLRTPRPAATSGSPTQRPRMWRELKDGIRYMAGNRTVRVVLLTSGAVWAMTGGLVPLEVFFVLENLNGSAELYGLLGTVASVGTIAGAALIAACGTRLSAPMVYTYGVVASGVVLICFSRMTTPLGALIVMFIDGVALAAVSSMVGPLLMRSTPAGLLGRVSSAFQPITQVASLISMSLTAWLASTALRGLDVKVSGVHFGPIDTLFLVAGLIVVLIGLLAARSIAHKSATRLEVRQ